MRKKQVFLEKKCINKVNKRIKIIKKTYNIENNIKFREESIMEEFKKEQLIKEKSEIEKEMELIKNIIKTREELKSDNKNFEFAEQELVDYYIYHIKANQAKLDYLIKLAKANGITIDIINQIKYEKYDEEIG